jgi:hypothetical protein
MRTSFHHQSEAQPPNGPLTAATSPDTPSTCPATQFVSVSVQALLYLAAHDSPGDLSCLSAMSSRRATPRACVGGKYRPNRDLPFQEDLDGRTF